MRNIVESKAHPMESDEDRVLLDHAQKRVIDTYNRVMDRFESKYKMRFDGELRLSRFKEEYLAAAILYKDYINVGLRNVLAFEINDTIMHELCHFIAHDNQLTGEFIAAQHGFLFGVLCCLVRRDLWGQKDNFFKPYDFHEDAMFQYLEINSFQFDKKIMGAKYESFEEMIGAAKVLSQDMYEEIEERIGLRPARICVVSEEFHN